MPIEQGFTTSHPLTSDLGNCGVEVSYWGTLPLGILVSALLGGATTPIVVSTR